MAYRLGAGAEVRCPQTARDTGSTGSTQMIRVMRPAVRRLWLLALLPLWAGCGGGGGDGQTTTPPSMQAQALRSFSGPQACPELEAYLEDQAVATMRAQLQASRDGVPGWGGIQPWVLTGAPGGVVNVVGDAAGRSAPVAFTGTNLRSAGVDEADIVKTDGTRILALAGATLQVLRSWPAAQLALEGSLPIEGQALELFMDGHARALVLSSTSQGHARSGFGDVVCIRAGCGIDEQSRVKLTEVDLEQPAKPRVARELYLPGRYVSARLIGRTLRVVLADDLHYPQELRWFPTWDEKLWADPVKLRAAWDELIAANEALIRAQPLSAWLPAAQRGSGAAAQALPPACSEFARVNAPVSAGRATVASWQLDEGTLARTTVLAAAGTVYASPRSLVLATAHWWSWPQIGQSDQTYLHQFDLTRPGRADYLGSGVVEGTLDSPFAIDETAGGALRVITTLQRRVADPAQPDNRWGRLETAARLTVLERRSGAEGGAWVEVGRTPDLAPGERVMSARILGERGFIVTFRQVDPLFAIDLAEPTRPRVVGELKVPGFSSYLHPIDANHLLGLGTYVPEPGSADPLDPGARSLQLSIFDVTDLAQPRQTFTQRIGTSSAFSEAQWDHRAFTYLAERGLLALPYASWESPAGTPTGTPDGAGLRPRTEVQLWHVDATRGLTPRGALPLDDLAEAAGDDGVWPRLPWPRRSLLADDWVYAITDLGVRVAHVDAPATPLATVVYPRPGPRTP